MKRIRSLFAKRWVRRICKLFMLVVLGVLAADEHVRLATGPYCYDAIHGIPRHRVGLVLGTKAGGNPYFTHRIDAAVSLYRAGVVEHLIVSGDNGRATYNEPMDMRTALIAAGVDSSDITLDFAGFRTMDSVVRALKVFGQNEFIVISQRFHNERAVYIARAHGINAIGFNAADVDARRGFRTMVREKFARAKVFVYLFFGVEPHFLGEPVVLGEQVLP